MHRLMMHPQSATHREERWVFPVRHQAPARPGSPAPFATALSKPTSPNPRLQSTTQSLAATLSFDLFGRRTVINSPDAGRAATPSDSQSTAGNAFRDEIAARLRAEG